MESSITARRSNDHNTAVQVRIPVNSASLPYDDVSALKVYNAGMKRLSSAVVLALSLTAWAGPPSIKSGQVGMEGTVFEADTAAKSFAIHNLMVTLPGKPPKDAYGDSRYLWNAKTVMYGSSGKIPFNAAKIKKGVRVRVMYIGETEAENTPIVWIEIRP